MKDADDTMNENSRKKHGMGVMSAKFFGAFVGGMNTNFSNFDDIKAISTEFSDVFSDKDFEGKDKNYPYSAQYFMDMRKAALNKLETAWDKALNNISGTNLGGAFRF